MNKLKQFILMLVMMFAVFLPLSNLTIKADQTDTSLEDIKKSGKLVVGLSADMNLQLKLMVKQSMLGSILRSLKNWQKISG